MSDHSARMDAHPDGKLILVVDDEFDVLSVYTMLFEFVGFRVRTASNGLEALALVRSEHPAIVLSDYMMPLMDGAELCEALRGDPALRHIPIILSSAGVLAGEVQPPCDAFFRKPIPFEALLAEINRLLAGPA